MAESLLNQIFSSKDGQEVKKNLTSIDDSLQKIFDGQKKFEEEQRKRWKAEDKRNAAEDKRKAREERDRKRKAADSPFAAIFGKNEKAAQKSLADKFKDLITKAFGGALKGIGSLFSKVLGGAINGLGSLIGKVLGGAITGLGGLLTKVLGGAIQGLGGILRSVFLKALTGLGPAAGPAAAAAATIGAGVVGGKVIGDKAQRALSDRVGGKGKTKKGTTYTFENIADLRNKQQNFLTQQGVSGKGATSALKGYNDLLERMKVTKSLNDQLYDAEQHLENIERQKKNGLPGYNKDEEKRQKELIAALKQNKEQSQAKQQKLFEALGLNDEDIERATLQRRGMGPGWWMMSEEEKKRYKELGLDKKQRGGPITVPGSGSGDKVPFMLPAGSFVMNRNAVGMFQNGGMVPTLLEPGEQIYGPGQWGPMEMMMNSVFSRFQKGGVVGQSDAGSARGGSVPTPTAKSTAPALEGAAAAGDSTGVSAVLKAAEKSQGLMAGIGEQCANSTRAVLKAAGHPAANKTTKKGDLDPEGLAYNAPSFAASFAGSDMGTVKRSMSSLAPGDIMLWKDTYGNYAPGAITHVGIAGEGNTQYDHGRGPGWRKRSRSSLANKFAYGITLGGKALGGFDAAGDFAMGGLETVGGMASGLMEKLGGMGQVGSVISGFLSQVTGAMGNYGWLINSMLGIGSVAASSVMGNTPLGSLSSQSSAAAGKWKPLLDLIASKESGGSYTKLYGGSEKADLTSMTLAQVDAFQQEHAKKTGSAAIGRYQFMNVLSQGKAAGLGPNDLFSPENQDKMAIQLIEGKRGVTMDMIKNNPAEAQLRLSQEWAALPKDESNLSFYHDDGRNKAHLTTAQMRDTFSKMQTGGVVNMRGAQSNARFTEAQKSFTEAIASAVGPPIVIVPPSGGGGGTTVVPTGSGQQMPPSLPDGPSSIQAAEYFYRLNMGSVY